jgi:hypothetical protein
LIINLQAKKDITEKDVETKNINLRRALDELTEYSFSGDFLNILYLQYDAELLASMEEIRSNFSLLSEYAFEYNELKRDERGTYRELFHNIKARIPEVQELINKKLEEL